jgi:hypothetical protein
MLPAIPKKTRFLGRQAILDQKMDLYGYELLFRAGRVNASSPSPDWGHRLLNALCAHEYGEFLQRGSPAGFGLGCRSGRSEAFAWPGVDAETTTISTRRFALRPSGVSLLADG